MTGAPDGGPGAGEDDDVSELHEALLRYACRCFAAERGIVPAEAQEYDQEAGLRRFMAWLDDHVQDDGPC